MNKSSFAFIICTLSVMFFLNVQIVSADTVVSQGFASGMHDVSNILTNPAVFNDYFSENTRCEKDALDFMAADLDFKGMEDALSIAYDKLVETIKEQLSKIHPAVAAAIGLYEVVDALKSSSSLEEFAEKIKDKIASKVGEELDAEREVDSIKRIWEEYEKIKGEKQDLVERFYKEIPQCNQHMGGMWDRRTGRYLITLNGNCKCQYLKNPKLQNFNVVLSGTITYEKTNAGTYQPKGKIDKDKLKVETVCKPCEKEMSYMIRNKDELYAYFKDNQDPFKKSLAEVPPQLMDVLKTQEIVQLAVYKKVSGKPIGQDIIMIAFKDGKVDEILDSLQFGDKRKTTLIIEMDDYSTLRGVLNAKDKYAAIEAALEQKKITLAGQTAINQVYFKMLMFGKGVYTAVNVGESYGAFASTKVYLVKQENANYNNVVSKSGSQLGYGCSNMAKLLAYKPNYYSNNAGIYYNPPVPAVTTLGGYGMSGAFVLGNGAAHNMEGNVYKW